jgi:hypothetical protein
MFMLVYYHVIYVKAFALGNLKTYKNNWSSVTCYVYHVFVFVNYFFSVAMLSLF